MWQERNILNSALSVILSEFISFIEPLKWFALLGFVLIIADLRFGIRAAKKRGESIRFSRAGRRTINKFVDYFCWVLLAAAIDKAFIPFSMPLLPAITLLVVYAFEINSCYSNYFAARGRVVKIDFIKLFKKKFDFFDFEVKDKEDEKRNESKNKKTAPPHNDTHDTIKQIQAPEQ